MLPADWGAGWPNVWLGTTVENQAEAARRIPHLAAIPAAVRFLSCEPLLELLDLTQWRAELDWIIVGGESGGGARAMHPAWARSLRDQARGMGASYFFKQVGSNRALWHTVKHLKGEEPAEWPADLRRQEFRAALDKRPVPPVAGIFGGALVPKAASNRSRASTRWRKSSAVPP